MKKYSLKLRALALCLLAVMLTCAFCGCAIVKNDGPNVSFNYDVLKDGSIDTALIKAYLEYNYKKAVADTDGIIKLVYNASEINAQSLVKYEKMMENDVKANIDFVYRDADGVELGTVTDLTYAIGSEIYTETFDRMLSETFIGAEREITVGFPAEYGADGKGDASLAGKTVTFDVKLNYIENKPTSSKGSDLSFNFKDMTGDNYYVGAFNGSASLGDKYVVSGDGSVSYGDKVVTGEGGSVTVTDKFVTIVGGSSGNATVGNGDNFYFTTVDGISGFSYTVSGMSISSQNNPIYSEVCTLQRYYGVDSSVVPDYGDAVSVDYSLWIDGNEFEKGTSSELTIGSGKYIEEIEAAMVGAPLGEEIVFDVVFPEDYEHKELAGKPCTVKGTVKRVDKVTIPEYNDENVNKYLGYESVAQYEEQYTDVIVEELLYDHLLHSVVLDTNCTDKREQMLKFLEESYAKLAVAENMTDEEYANNVLLQLVKANNSSVYMQFLTGMVYSSSNNTALTNGEVKAYSVLEVKKSSDGDSADISAFNSYSFYMATVYSVQLVMLEKLVEKYPELAMTDDEFNAKATAYLQDTLNMNDSDVAEYLSGEGRNVVWVALMKDVAIEMMKANYNTVG